MELKNKMEGKVVIAVESSEICEVICKFVMSDGNAFRLHATDLGFWLEDTIVVGDKYNSFDMIFRDYHYHHYNLGHKYDYDVPNPKIVIKNNTLIIKAVDGKIFEADINLLSEWECNVITHPRGIELITVAATFGDMWKIIFKEEDCPLELKLK